MNDLSRSAAKRHKIRCVKFRSKKSKQGVRTTSHSHNALLSGSKAIGSDVDEDWIDESAIDDKDASEWEDVTEEIGEPIIDEKFFRRIEVKVDRVPSKPSLIARMHFQTRNEESNSLSPDPFSDPSSKKSEVTNTISYGHSWYMCASDRYNRGGW